MDDLYAESSSRPRVASHEAPTITLPDGRDTVASTANSLPNNTRPRAGTMPSMMQSDLSAGPNLRRPMSGISLNAMQSRTPDEDTPPLQQVYAAGTGNPLLAPSNSATSRLRSGSLTLPTNGLGNAFGPSVFSNRTWTPTDNYNGGMPSPSIPEETRSVASDDDAGQDAVGTMDYLAGLIGSPLVSPAASSMAGPSIDAQMQQLQIKGIQDSPGRLRANTVAAFARANRGSSPARQAPTETRSGNLLSSHEALTAALRPRAATVGLFQPEDTASRKSVAHEVTTVNRSPELTPAVSFPMSSSSSQEAPYVAALDIGLVGSLPPSRSLWVGNLDSRTREAELLQTFSPYGAVESIRVLPEKNCAFINYVTLQSAMYAREDIMTRLGGQITSIPGVAVQIGFAKPEPTSHFQPPGQTMPFGPTDNQSIPSRALWIGTLPTTATSSDLLPIFGQWGSIDSVRVLTHKSCAFVNYERLDDAVRARKALNGREIFGPEVGQVKIGFARLPMRPSGTLDSGFVPQPPPPASMGTASRGRNVHTAPLEAQQPFVPSHNGNSYDQHSDLTTTASSEYSLATLPLLPAEALPHTTELQSMMFKLSPRDDSLEADKAAIADPLPPVSYFAQVPNPPGWIQPGGMYGGDSSKPVRVRSFDVNRLRDIRKRLETAPLAQDEIELLVQELLDDSAILSSDYLGNTVIQKLFELCSSASRIALLERIGPHLASIGTHKNGTWAAQKLIELSDTPQEIAIICRHLKPFIPPLLLDQFGNYVVGGTLKFGSPASDMVFDAMFQQCWDIGQGRFGARGMRTCLENAHTPRLQQKRVAIAILLNAVPLSTNPNGALLLTWLLDSSGFPGRYRLLAPRLASHMPHLCTHKIASTTVLRLINQNIDVEASRLIIETIFEKSTDILEELLADQVQGISFVQKVIASPYLEVDQRQACARQVERAVQGMGLEQVPAYSHLLQYLTSGNLSVPAPLPASSMVSTPLQSTRAPRQASPLASSARASPASSSGPPGWVSTSPAFFSPYSSPYMPVGSPPLGSPSQLNRQPDMYQGLPFFTRPPADMIPPPLMGSPGPYGPSLPGGTSPPVSQGYYADANAIYGMPYPTQ